MCIKTIDVCAAGLPLIEPRLARYIHHPPLALANFVIICFTPATIAVSTMTKASLSHLPGQPLPPQSD